MKQIVDWEITEKYETATDTCNEGEQIYQGETIRVHVSDKVIKQKPIEERYMVEESRQKIRHKPKRKVQKEVIHKYSETESDSADEVIVHKRPVEKTRFIPQVDIVQKVIEEQPSEKIVKHRVETISVPVKRTVQDRIHETVNIETEEEKRRKIYLRQQIDLKITERASFLTRIDQMIFEMETEYAMLMNKATTEVRERFVNREVTEYVEKKMRRMTKEVPVPCKISLYDEEKYATTGSAIHAISTHKES